MKNHKLAILASLTLFSFILVAGIASATGWQADYNSNANAYLVMSPAYSEYNIFGSGSRSSEFSQYPSWNSNGATYDSSYSSNFDSNSYSKISQGPLIDRTTKYDEYLTTDGWDRITRTINIRTYDKYLGAYESVSSNSQNRQSSGSDYATFYDSDYDGGFSWSQQSEYDKADYGKDSYWDTYYYAPRLDNGHYVWRY